MGAGEVAPRPRRRPAHNSQRSWGWSVNYNYMFGCLWGVGRFSGSPILNLVNCIIAEGRGGVFAGDGQF